MGWRDEHSSSRTRRGAQKKQEKEGSWQKDFRRFILHSVNHYPVEDFPLSACLAVCLSQLQAHLVLFSRSIYPPLAPPIPPSPHFLPSISKQCHNERVRPHETRLWIRITRTTRAIHCARPKSFAVMSTGRGVIVFVVVRWRLFSVGRKWNY